MSIISKQCTPLLYSNDTLYIKMKKKYDTSHKLKEFVAQNYEGHEIVPQGIVISPASTICFRF